MRSVNDIRRQLEWTERNLEELENRKEGFTMEWYISEKNWHAGAIQALKFVLETNHKAVINKMEAN